jgi:hypothetical protein
MDSEHYTPLPDSVSPEREDHHAAFHLPSAVFFGMLILIIVLSGGWYLYSNTGFLSQNSGTDDRSPTITLPFSEPTPTRTVEDGGVGPDWTRQLNSECGTTFFIPPADEPYLIPRDPNTLPTATDDEGKYWIYEDNPSTLFMFNHLARVIFKNPELPGSGYVSAAVEVMCADNTEKYTTESLFVKIQNDLLQNFSVISLASSGGASLWEREVKTAVFEGGTFNDDTYYLFATNSHIYLIRSMGETNNASVQQVRDSILLNLAFE